MIKFIDMMNESILLNGTKVIEETSLFGRFPNNEIYPKQELGKLKGGIIGWIY